MRHITASFVNTTSPSQEEDVKHKTVLYGDNWSVTYAPLGATRHNTNHVTIIHTAVVSLGGGGEDHPG